MLHYGSMFRRLHYAAEQKLTSALAEMELTGAQGVVLGFVRSRQTPPTPREVEDALHLSHATVAGLLARLEKKGFIRQEADTTDRRCKRILIEPRGMECMETMHHTIDALDQQIVREFTPEEQQLFSRFLERAAENMQVLPEEILCLKEDDHP